MSLEVIKQTSASSAVVMAAYCKWVYSLEHNPYKSNSGKLIWGNNTKTATILRKIEESMKRLMLFFFGKYFNKKRLYVVSSFLMLMKSTAFLECRFGAHEVLKCVFGILVFIF